MLAMTAMTLMLPLAGCQGEDAARTRKSEPASAALAAPAGPVESPQMAVLRQAIAGNPDDSRAHHMLGRLLSEAEQHHEAIQHFEQAVQLNPSIAHLFDLAIALEAAVRLNEAEATFKEDSDHFSQS